MSKALEVLKHYKKVTANMPHGMPTKRIIEAIAELEAQVAKSCKNCTWWEESEEDDTSNPRWCGKGISEGYTTSITDEDFCCNKHAPKDA